MKNGKDTEKFNMYLSELEDLKKYESNLESKDDYTKLIGEYLIYKTDSIAKILNLEDC